MTLGQWIDYVIEWNNDSIPKETVKRATQEDFERFKHM